MWTFDFHLFAFVEVGEQHSIITFPAFPDLVSLLGFVSLSLQHISQSSRWMRLHVYII